MRLTVLLILTILFSCDTARNTPDPSNHFFVRYYGDDGDQEGVDMVANTDGTFMLLSTSRLNNNSNVYLVKVSSNGDVIWETSFVAAENEEAKDIEATSDGNYIILSNATSILTGSDVHIRKIDDNGNVLSEGTYTQPGSSNEIGESVTEVIDDINPGFIVAGNSNYDNGQADYKGVTALFIRFNADCSNYTGTWSNHAGAERNDYCVKVFQRGSLVENEPFLLFGYSNSSELTATESYNFWTSKMNSIGVGVNFEPGIIDNSSDEYLRSVVPNSPSPATSKNYFLAGIEKKSNGSENVFIHQLTDNPKSIDNIDLGNITSQPATANKVSAHLTKRGHYLILATKFVTNSDLVLFKVNSNGTLLWKSPQFFGGSGNDFGSAVYELPDERILVMGTMQIGDEKQSKIVLMKTNKDGLFKN